MDDRQERIEPVAEKPEAARMTQPADVQTTLQQPQKPAVTAAQKWLLLAALAVGVAWRFVWEQSDFWDWGGWQGVFWLVAMAAVTPFIWKRAIKSRTGLACGVAAIALCVLQMVRAQSMSGEVGDLGLLLFVSIPMTMLLYLAFAAYDIPVKREGLAVRRMLAAVFVHPFTGMPTFFRAIGALFTRNKAASGGWKRTLTGAGVGVVLAVCVTLLLMRADQNMNRLFAGLFDAVRMWDWYWRMIAVFLTAMLFYGVFEHAARPVHAPLAEREWPACPASTMTAVLIPPLIVYAMFCCLQFSYLFGSALPGALTYSEYARQGFGELNFVAAINFTLFGVCLRYARPSRVNRVLSALLLVATMGIVASCAARLLLYIGAYGLTMLRILPLWLAIFYAALTLLCAARLILPKLPALRVGGIAFLYWFVVLNLPDWAAVIAAYNAAHGMG